MTHVTKELEKFPSSGLSSVILFHSPPPQPTHPLSIYYQTATCMHLGQGILGLVVILKF